MDPSRRSRMTATIALTPQQVQRFADASGDRNPLHVDERFARATPYGRCIAHGALVTMAALGDVDPRTLRHVTRLDVQFKLPVFPHDTYRVLTVAHDGRPTRVEVTGGGRLVAGISVVADADAPPLVASTGADAPLEVTAPRHMSIDQLRELREPVVTRYACRMPQLRALAAEVGGRGLPDALLTWLAAASYCVGMLIPGRDAVFAGARFERSPSSATGRLTLTVSAADERTGLVALDCLLESEAAVRLTLHAFLRPPVPPPDRSSIGRHLPASSALRGGSALVVGASRGFGAAVAGALATQQATVWAAYSRSTARAEALRLEFGADRIRLLEFDASDPDACREALTARSAPAALDGIVLSAAPPSLEMALHPEATAALKRFVEASVAMTLVPLANALPLLKPNGWIVFTSSPAVGAPPLGAPHQVIAKSAVEGAAGYCAGHTDARVLILRPPAMRTDSANTPLGRIGAAEPEQIAAEVVRWVTSSQTTGGVSVLSAEALLDPRPGHAELDDVAPR